jgi:hypothetical protein
LDDANEAERLRALVTLMRDGGLTRLVLPDGTTLERPPMSPIEMALAARQASSAASEDDDLDEMDRDERAKEREEADTESAWNSYWSRMTASSGSGIPKYPGVEKASKFLGARHS